MEIIPFDQFTQSDIRVGVIRYAEIVPGSEKLLRCMVELGDDVATMDYLDASGVTYHVRQIVSGIRNYYTPEDVIGTYALYIVNVPVRTMMGLESQGMLMAVGENDCVMLRPHKDVTPGSQIH